MRRFGVALRVHYVAKRKNYNQIGGLIRILVAARGLTAGPRVDEIALLTALQKDLSNEQHWEHAPLWPLK